MPNHFLKTGLVLLALNNLSAVSFGEESVKLGIGIKGARSEFTIAEIQKKIALQNVNLQKNPNYENKPMAYEGVNLKSLIASVLPSVASRLSQYKIVFTCLDGYRPVLDGDILNDGNAYLVTRELNPGENGVKAKSGNFTLLKAEAKMVDPGPFYLVWDSAAHFPDAWPYQVADISLVLKTEFAETAQLAPRGDFDTATASGYQVFLKNCTACHSIRYIGPHGRAPDLAYVVGYRSEDYIRTTLKNGRGMMPAFKEILKPAEIIQLIAYLKNSANDLKH